MAEGTITLDEMVVAVMVAGADGRINSDALIEAINTLRQIRGSVAMLAELQGVDLDTVLDPARSLAIISEAGEFLLAGQAVTR